jgi:hypothetical protein
MKISTLNRVVCVFLTIILFASCGPTIYKSAGFDNTKRTVKVIAIVPYTVSIDSKRLPKGVTIETLKESQEKTGYDMQNATYTWLLQRQNEYTVKFQDVDQTNAILKKNNLNIDNVYSQDRGELCKILGVDAIITGKATMSRPMSDGAAIALTFLVGAWGATNNTTVSLAIHDQTSNLLWKYDYQVAGAIGSNTESLTKFLMKNASKKFPYRYN